MEDSSECEGGCRIVNVTIQNPVLREIDFEKVKTLEDMKVILAEVRLTMFDGTPTADRLRRFLKDL